MLLQSMPSYHFLLFCLTIFSQLSDFNFIFHCYVLSLAGNIQYLYVFFTFSNIQIGGTANAKTHQIIFTNYPSD